MDKFTDCLTQLTNLTSKSLMSMVATPGPWDPIAAAVGGRVEEEEEEASGGRWLREEARELEEGDTTEVLAGWEIKRWAGVTEEKQTLFWDMHTIHNYQYTNLYFRTENTSQVRSNN